MSDRKFVCCWLNLTIWLWNFCYPISYNRNCDTTCMTLQSPLSLPSNPQPDLFTDTMNMADSQVANIVNEILVCFTWNELTLVYDNTFKFSMKCIFYFSGWKQSRQHSVASLFTNQSKRMKDYQCIRKSYVQSWRLLAQTHRNQPFVSSSPYPQTSPIDIKWNNYFHY